MKLGEFPSAVKDCEKAIELNPKFVKAYINSEGKRKASNSIIYNLKNNITPTLFYG